MDKNIFTLTDKDKKTIFVIDILLFLSAFMIAIDVLFSGAFLVTLGIVLLLYCTLQLLTKLEFNESSQLKNKARGVVVFNELLKFAYVLFTLYGLIFAFIFFTMNALYCIVFVLFGSVIFCLMARSIIKRELKSLSEEGIEVDFSSKWLYRGVYKYREAG